MVHSGMGRSVSSFSIGALVSHPAVKGRDRDGEINMFYDFLRSRRSKSVVMVEAYRIRAAQLRRQAIEPENLRRRSLLFVAAWEYEMLADRMADAAEMERASAIKARMANRRRRVRGEARAHGTRVN